jgi:hypothetical protein
MDVHFMTSALTCIAARWRNHDRPRPKLDKAA